ncbi:MAG: hypothetical protein G01um101448_1146 [Parcubacteria group bacterium Gr01-1014_48]|nr:MAG: hypothetical protein G01um101448_1146 [Parcubacteria group bacterium Gr01-1014_48]
MNIINNLVLGSAREQKFIVMTLSDGTTHFCTSPLYIKVGGKTDEVRHKDIVAKFCKENGFDLKHVLHGAIGIAINRDKVKMEVDGGGLIRTTADSASIYAGNASGDYGEAPRSVVEHCIREAMQKEGLEGYRLAVCDVRES